MKSTLPVYLQNDKLKSEIGRVGGTEKCQHQNIYKMHNLSSENLKWIMGIVVSWLKTRMPKNNESCSFFKFSNTHIPRKKLMLSEIIGCLTGYADSPVEYATKIRVKYCKITVNGN